MGKKICEIRLRVDRPVIVETSREDYFLNNGGEWQEHPYGAHLVTEAEIRELIAWLCQDSVYAYADEIRQGFFDCGRRTPDRIVRTGCVGK